MRQEIVEQMRAELYDSIFCSSDFEIDLKYLKGKTSPIFWMVRNGGTCMMQVDIASIVENFESKAYRLAMFRDPNGVLSSFKYYKDDSSSKYFYFDGYKLLRIESYEELEMIWYAVAGPYYWKMRKIHADEYEMANKPLEVRCSGMEVKKKLDKAMKLAESLNDKSLDKCLKRLSRYTRVSTDEYIVIGFDHYEHSFSFAQMVDGRCVMNGGVIYDADRAENKWQIHT